MEKSRKNRKDKLDLALGLLIIGNNLSFSLVDSEVFKQFVYMLDPSYKIPCRQTLSTNILDKTYENVYSVLKPKKHVKGTLMIDGWKNTSNNTKTVTAILKPEEGVELFLKSFDFSEQSENHTNLLEIVMQSRELALSNFNMKVTSIVTDNAAVMRKTGHESNLINYGCKAHVANLYVSDIYDKDVYIPLHSIMVVFKNTRLQECIKNHGGKSIYLANDTRWKVKKKYKNLLII